MRKENSIIAIVIEPNKKPHISSIIDTISSFEELVGGEIQSFSAMEFAQVPYSYGMYCSRISSIIKVNPNRRIGNIMIFGTLIIIGDDNMGRHCSLKEEQIEFFMNRFKEI